MIRSRIIYIVFLLLTVCSTMVSCLKDVDFDQVNQFEMSPVVENSLVYSELPVPVVDSIPFPYPLVLSDTTRIELFSSSFSVDNLDKAELYFETLSTVSQPLSVEIQLLDDHYTVIEELSMSLLSSDGEEESSGVELIYTEENMEKLTNVTQIIFYITIPYFGNRNEGAYVKLKSKGTFYLHIEG
ncbi:hypothetical protein [Sinomicrobium sp. M5D2P9]